MKKHLQEFQQRLLGPSQIQKNLNSQLNFLCWNQQFLLLAIWSKNQCHAMNWILLRDKKDAKNIYILLKDCQWFFILFIYLFFFFMLYSFFLFFLTLSMVFILFFFFIFYSFFCFFFNIVNYFYLFIYFFFWFYSFFCFLFLTNLKVFKAKISSKDYRQNFSQAY